MADQVVEEPRDTYATVADIQSLFRKLTQDEQTRAKSLLSVVADSLRVEAKKVGKDLDAMLKNNEPLKSVAKSVVVDVVARALMTSTNQEPMSQYSESALGYSASGTFLVAGGGLFIKKSELARLGLKRQKVGTIDFYDQGNND